MMVHDNAAPLNCLADSWPQIDRWQPRKVIVDCWWLKECVDVLIAALLASTLLSPAISDACSRAVYFGKEGQVATGRTMDWFVSDMDTNMWLYPRGLERSSDTSTPLNWKSKYGSVVVTMYEGAAAKYSWGQTPSVFLGTVPMAVDPHGS